MKVVLSEKEVSKKYLLNKLLIIKHIKVIKTFHNV
jgi:hypothetical protein